LWFPTLVYQTSYPRTSSVRPWVVIKLFAEVAGCVIYTYAIFVRYVAPHTVEFCGDYYTMFLGIFKVMIPGISVFLLGFYGILHCWLNAFAELTRFADRHFYSDWWNTTSWAAYYRKWNAVVHNFLHRHVFMYFHLHLGWEKTVSMGLTFLISAVVHEYIIFAALGVYKPILFLMFLVPGVGFIFLTRGNSNSRIWNVFMWAMLLMGHGFLVGLYTRAWHLYHRDPTAYYSSPLSLVWVV